MHPNGLPIEGTITHLRSGIKAYAAMVRDCLKSHPHSGNETDGVQDEGEMKANLTLTYRHLEEAAMRFGKALQAKNGGVSIYDK